MKLPDGPRKRRKARAQVEQPLSADDKHRQQLALPIAALVDYGLPLRVVNILEARHVILVVDLVRLAYEDLAQMPNMGDSTIEEIRKALSCVGVTSPKWVKRSAQSTDWLTGW